MRGQFKFLKTHIKESYETFQILKQTFAILCQLVMKPPLCWQPGDRVSHLAHVYPVIDLRNDKVAIREQLSCFLLG